VTTYSSHTRHDSHADYSDETRDGDTAAADSITTEHFQSRRL